MWYILGRDVARGAPRMFRMDRIAEPNLRHMLRFRPEPAVVRALRPPEVRWESLLGAAVA